MADFKRLGYFVQVAELGSLTRAADRLRIAQPSLSRQMRLLEEELGVVLFTRGHRGMELTEAGEALRLQISGPLRQIGHALYEVRSLPTETTGTVIFGIPPTLASFLGEQLIGRACSRAPGINLQLVEGQSGHLLEWMRRGDLDAAILYGPTPNGLNATRLLDDDLMLVGSPDSPASVLRQIDVKTLAELPLALPSDAHGIRMAVEAAAGRARMRLNVTAVVDSFQLSKRLAASGQVYTILPEVAVRDELANGTLAITPFAFALRRQLFIAMQSSAEAPRAILQIEQIVRDEVAALVHAGVWRSARQFKIGDS